MSYTKPETEANQIDGCPFVQNILCVIDVNHSDLPEEYTKFIEDETCITYQDTRHHGEDLYSIYSIDEKIEEEKPSQLVIDTNEKMRQLLDANDAGYFRLIH